jgi:hypothetical protein
MEHSITEAMELWKRVFDWTGNHTWQRICFFCGEDKPDHAPGCTWTKAKELVKADERGSVK